ncbi:hypothetical protein T4E_8768 [Trichinella pseudospiralis]|uniref:Uncharacterized protein n=1 Tax=Trichinella pseudospiralis TaxID=6337 RepID=A0A0V0Y3S1_TRIPS|nr:hypothetical protein T4E_8768 [Trichinella pseudospiralis]
MKREFNNTLYFRRSGLFVILSKVIENKSKYPLFWHHSKVEHTKSVRYDAQVLMNIASYCVGSLFL